MALTWNRHQTKATAHYNNGQLAASVHPSSVYFSDFEMVVYNRDGKQRDRRGAVDLEDGIGMATCILAGSE